MLEVRGGGEEERRSVKHNVEHVGGEIRGRRVEAHVEQYGGEEGVEFGGAEERNARSTNQQETHRLLDEDDAARKEAKCVNHLLRAERRSVSVETQNVE